MIISQRKYLPAVSLSHITTSFFRSGTAKVYPSTVMSKYKVRMHLQHGKHDFYPKSLSQNKQKRSTSTVCAIEHNSHYSLMQKMQTMHLNNPLFICNTSKPIEVA